MKVTREQSRKPLYENRLIISKKKMQEAGAQKRFHFEFTVDGIKSSQDVSALTLKDGQDLIRKQYNGKTVAFQKSEEKPKQPNAVQEDFEVDDEFVEFETEKKDYTSYEHGEAPKEGPESAMASTINALIRDEWEAIEGYNSAILVARECGMSDICEVLTGIQNEENKHVGELQRCLELVTDSATLIQDGQKEAAQEMTNADEEANAIETEVKDFVADDEF